MNKKNIITQKNIMEVADWLETACDYFKFEGEGCYNFPLSDDLVLAVGWSYGYDMADEDLIKSKYGQEQCGDWTCGWAVNAGIKIRNDSDCADYDFLNYPWYKDGEVADTGLSMSPYATRRSYRKDARWFLEKFVEITNAYKKGEINYN